jgi:hypothetical protein
MSTSIAKKFVAVVVAVLLSVLFIGIVGEILPIDMAFPKG